VEREIHILGMLRTRFSSLLCERCATLMTNNTPKNILFCIVICDKIIFRKKYIINIISSMLSALESLGVGKKRPHFCMPIWKHSAKNQALQKMK
jgi:hypothetical protein